MKGFNYTLIGIRHILTDGMYFKADVHNSHRRHQNSVWKDNKNLLKHHFCNIKAKMASCEPAFEGNELEELYQTEQ